MIKNDLPITLEPVEFPEGLILQGRMAPKPILRVDGPQSVLKQNGPHFAASEGPSNGSSLQDVIAQLDAPERPAIRRPHFAGVEKQKVAAATSGERGPQDSSSGQVSDRSNAPLAKALFELEQGGRS